MTVRMRRRRASQRVVHEVHRPLLVASRGHRAADPNRRAPMPSWSLELQNKPFQRVETVDALVIHPPPFAAQVNVQLAVAGPHSSTGELAQPPAQRCLVGATTSVA
jgi:hypothetical protein